MLFGEDFLQFPEYITNINDFFQIRTKKIDTEKEIFKILWIINDRWFLCPIMPNAMDHLVLPNGFCSCTFNYMFNCNSLTDAGTIYNIDSFTRCKYGRPWFFYVIQARQYGFLDRVIDIYSLESMNKLLRPNVELDPFWDTLESYSKRNWAVEQKCWRTVAFERCWNDGRLYSIPPPGYDWVAIYHRLDGWEEFNEVAEIDWRKKEPLVISYKKL